MTKKQKRTRLRIIVTAVIYALLLVLEYTGVLERISNPFAELLLFFVPYIIISYDVIARALKNISHAQIFDENFLMLIATVAAFCVGKFSEAVAVMLLYQIGELFQSYAVGKSRQSISAMMDIAAEYANIEENGELIQVDPEEVQIGSVIVIKPGERVPLDGVVIEGDSFVDTAALTGESVPRRVTVGEAVISGCVNGSNALKVKTTKAFEDSTVTRILELVENASSKKAKVENFITRFAKVYTPVVTACAVVLAVAPPLVFGGDWGEWIQRACTFLVLSCPCALVISVPLGFFGGIGAASGLGVLVKGSNYLEALAQMNTIVFDKTGTLTKGEFTVSQINAAKGSSGELLEIAALCEGYSNHPIANSIRRAYQQKPDLSRVENSREIAGEGVCALVDGREVLLGNSKLMLERGIDFKETDSAGTVIYIAANNRFMGTLIISDVIKDEAKQAVDYIKAAGVKKCVMLTGDRREAAQAVADELKLEEVHSELLPADKVTVVERLLAQQGKKEKLVFVGDGINDAPVLSRADVGIAMGSMGSDAAIEAADIVIMDDDTRKIASTVMIARRTVRIVRQNIVLALAVKAIIMLLGVLGMANMWMAVFGDVGVAFIAILNSMRCLKAKGYSDLNP